MTSSRPFPVGENHLSSGWPSQKPKANQTRSLSLHADAWPSPASNADKASDSDAEFDVFDGLVADNQSRVNPSQGFRSAQNTPDLLMTSAPVPQNKNPKPQSSGNGSTGHSEEEKRRKEKIRDLELL
ncbi:hypothetical protein CAPTEDRAFT_189246 [Capitella teleta]|uniref:Uncharacterized protein n=1 Tax=Capitella teleta TaxID=283909 RepID=R7UTB1_CAPTE|nr:hypothetical protein CAPTEDRAFT_189246 [Capitella teleta]|eukprot:ELU06611.1 hypothetical protein CAPTEDRAFT_189246 [Capitella teleta]